MSDNTNRESITRAETSNKDTLKQDKQSTKRARISYSTSSEASLNDSITMSCNEMEDIIKKTIDTALQLFESELKTVIENKHQELKSLIENDQKEIFKRIEHLESENFELKQSNEELKKSLSDMKDESKTNHDLISTIENDVKLNSIKTNNNEQYSRKNNIRIFGLPQVDKKEDPTKVVLSFIKEKLNLKHFEMKEIEAAHRVGISRNNRPQAMIIRFARRDSRMEVLKNRKCLKNSPFVVTEDLTRLNVLLLNRAKNHPRIDQAWSWNCKCWAIGKNGNKIKLSLFSDIDALLDVTNH